MGTVATSAKPLTLSSGPGLQLLLKRGLGFIRALPPRDWLLGWARQGGFSNGLSVPWTDCHLALASQFLETSSRGVVFLLSLLPNDTSRGGWQPMEALTLPLKDDSRPQEGSGQGPGLGVGFGGLCM